MTFCNMCGGKGRVPDMSHSGPMSYYNPNTGESWPHKICPNCGGTGTVGLPGSNDPSPRTAGAGKDQIKFVADDFDAPMELK